MRVAAIASSLSELRSACSVALSRLAADGHEVHAVIVSRGAPPAASREGQADRNIGVSRIHLVHDFDYSAITQANADKINACVKIIEPLVVIMPHWKSTNPDHMILARTSLVACRGIGSILMYEINDNANFTPTILFPSKRDNGHASLDNAERYESHRLLLLDEMEMV
jgi:LmbE family N-acetylglucosaminyl deacetylase